MKTLREMMDQLDEITRRDLIKGAGALSIAPAFQTLANDYNVSDKETTLLAMLFNALWVCKSFPERTDSFHCSKISAGLWDYAAKRRWDRTALNSFYNSANTGIEEKLKDPRWVEIINNSYKNAENLLKLLNQENSRQRPFEDSQLEETSPDALAKIDDLTRK
jgi:hypothetical protein